MMKQTYVIDAASASSAVLYSIVPTSWGGVARNYVAAGNVSDIEALKEKLEKSK